MITIEKEVISVIMGAYNEEPVWIKKTIDSILNQTYSNFEYIIILDNPNNFILDELLDKYSKKDKRIRYYKNSTNIGLVKTLNKAIELSCGSYIARIDADDIAYKQRFEEQINFLKNNVHISLVGTNVELIDENDNLIKKSKNIIKNHNHIRYLIKFRNLLYHPSIMIRKEDIIKVGLYREVKFAEDYDLYCRLINRNYKIANINKTLIKYRIRNNGITKSNRDIQIENSIKVLKMYKNEVKYGEDKYEEVMNSNYSINLLEKFIYIVKVNFYKVYKLIFILIEKL